ncbi:MAG: helix-turn-helix domain-containing protein [Pseudomonadota bacterium]|nr:helix-turn-helix domain-containing protein [Pseudomonadota bacterium]
MNAKKPKPVAKRGRPTQYRAIYAAQAEAFCLCGADDAKLAEMFEVDVATINRWKARYTEFCASLKRGKDIADAAVASALYKSATGGHFIVEDRVVGDQVVTLRKRIAPDVLAQIYWLKNRQPKHWRGRVEVKEDVNLNVFPPKEVLDAMYARALERARERDAFLIGRRERLGIPVDPVEGD